MAISINSLVVRYQAVVDRNITTHVRNNSSLLIIAAATSVCGIVPPSLLRILDFPRDTKIPSLKSMGAGLTLKQARQPLLCGGGVMMVCSYLIARPIGIHVLEEHSIGRSLFLWRLSLDDLLCVFCLLQQQSWSLLRCLLSTETFGGSVANLIDRQTARHRQMTDSGRTICLTTPSSVAVEKRLCCCG